MSDIKERAWIEGVIYVVNNTDAEGREDHMDIFLEPDIPVSAEALAKAILEADEGNVIEVVHFEAEWADDGDAENGPHPYITRLPFLRIIDLQASENFMMSHARIDELMSGGTSMRGR